LKPFPQIPISYYLDPAVLERENAAIFQRNWQPVALLADLPARNDFIVTRIGGRELVIQNFGDRISAFTNTCSHRFSALQTETRGNRPLQCPYHRWTFNHAGIPSTIPQLEDFSCLADAPRESLALEKWQLEVCGNLIFVRLASAGSSLREHLGNLYAWLENVTTQLGHEIEPFEAEIDANWKVVMQNTVEFGHVFSVHPETFRPLVELPLRVIDRQAPAPHIRYVTLMKPDKTQARIDAMLARHFLQPVPVSDNGYEHLLVFPCLTVGHTNGRAFSFFRYEPDGPGRTRLSVRTWLPRARVASAALNEFCASTGAEIGAFIRRLADEDTRICEAAHRGIANAPAGWKMHFADGEYLVARLHQHYLNVMGEAFSASDEVSPTDQPLESPQT